MLPFTHKTRKLRQTGIQNRKTFALLIVQWFHFFNCYYFFGVPLVCTGQNIQSNWDDIANIFDGRLCKQSTGWGNNQCAKSDSWDSNKKNWKQSFRCGFLDEFQNWLAIPQIDNHCAEALWKSISIERKTWWKHSWHPPITNWLIVLNLKNIFVVLAHDRNQEGITRR